MESCQVAPFAGAWIEISNGHWLVVGTTVAPFAGAWIEIGSSGQRKRRVSAAETGSTDTGGTVPDGYDTPGLWR